MNSDNRYVPRGYLKYYRVIRYFFCAKYNLTYPDLEMLFFYTMKNTFQEKILKNSTSFLVGIKTDLKDYEKKNGYLHFENTTREPKQYTCFPINLKE